MKTLEVGLLLPESGADVLPHLLVQLRPWDVIYKQRRLKDRRMQSCQSLAGAGNTSQSPTEMLLSSSGSFLGLL